MIYINKSIRIWLILVVMIIGFNSDVFSQKKPVSKDRNKKTKTEKTEIINQTPSDCEYIKLVLDQAMIDIQNLQNSYLIIIFKSGQNEKQGINTARITDVEEFLKLRKINNPYVLAEGSKVKGLGKAEVYVKGELREEIFFDNNSKNPCENEPY